MFVFMPVIVISGVMLLFPEKAPDRVLGIGGILPVAILHSFSGFIIVCFSLLHIYLATTGKTVGELTKAILSGWYLAELEEEEVDLRHEAAKQKINENKRLFPIIFYNPLTIAGTFIAFLSFGAIIFFTFLLSKAGKIAKEELERMR